MQIILPERLITAITVVSGCTGLILGPLPAGTGSKQKPAVLFQPVFVSELSWLLDSGNDLTRISEACIG